MKLREKFLQDDVLLLKNRQVVLEIFLRLDYGGLGLVW